MFVGSNDIVINAYKYKIMFKLKNPTEIFETLERFLEFLPTLELGEIQNLDASNVKRICLEICI